MCKFSGLDQFAESEWREAFPLAQQNADRVTADLSHPSARQMQSVPSVDLFGSVALTTLADRR